MTKTDPETARRSYRIRLAAVIVLVLAAYVVVPQLHSFHQSFSVVRHTRLSWLLWGLVAIGISYFWAALTYCLLAKPGLRFWPTLTVQMASMFTNRILPAGAGAIGINYAYLVRQKHSPAEASVVVGLNNLLGFIGHLLLLLSLVLFAPSVHLPPWHFSRMALWLALAVVAVAALVVWFVVQRKRGNLQRFLGQLITALNVYQQHWNRFGLALVSSMAVTSCYVATLYCVARAAGIELPLSSIFLVLTFGVAATTAVPTPGGVGAAEAGLTTALIAYRVDSATALAAALLYRLLTYWLPFVIGIGGLVLAQRRGYVGLSKSPQ